MLALARRVSQAGIPVFAVHGLRDPVCPRGNPHRLARAVPGVHVAFVNAGHLGSEPALARAMKRSIDAMLAT